MMRGDFFTYQIRALNILLAWGGANVAAGIAASRSGDPLVRHVGWQALTWGAIDGALALAGQQQARHKRRELADSADRYEEMVMAAARFRQILLLNAILDGGYIGGGLWLAYRAHERRDRQGMGLGIALQGAFLLAYDTLLARDVHERWIEHTS